jgi:hypothetical protein
MLVNATEPPGDTEAGRSVALMVTPTWLLFAVTLLIQAFGTVDVDALAGLAGSK